MGNNLLVQEIDKAGGIDFSRPVLLGYSGISDALLLKYIEDSRHIWEGKLKEIRYTTVGSVIGTHAGPGADTRSVFHDLIQIVRGDAKPIGIAPDGMILLEGMVY